MNAGLISYGISLPRCRISADAILQVWQNTHKQILQRMGYNERCVLYPDQDTITLSIDAAKQALDRSPIDRKNVGALILGTGTNPYATKASVTVIGEALGLSPHCISFDLQFAGKSGTSALIAALALVDSGKVDYAIAIGADTINRHIPCGHWLEYGASAGAVALIVGKDHVIAECINHSSYTQDQNDYFRVEGERYIQVGCGVTGYVTGWGIEENMVPAAQKLFEKVKITPSDIDACALHQNSYIAPFTVSKALSLDFARTVQPNLLTDRIGDCGAASSLLALAAILDRKEAESTILLGSYGNGAGSDFFLLRTCKQIQSYPLTTKTTQECIDNKIMVDYGTAQKYEQKYIRGNLITGNL
jgi:2-acetylphloroglucinol acetyltransferase